MAEQEKSDAPRQSKHANIHFDAEGPQLSFARRIQVPIIAATGIALIRTIGPTLRFDIPGHAHTDRVHAAGRRCVYAFWHRGLFPMLWHSRNQGIVALSSTNFDGQWASRVTRGMGFGSAFGSSSRGGLRGLAQLAQRMRQGRDTAFTVDGPRGPRYVAKPGPVLLAQRTGCPIICFHAYSEHAYVLKKSWDLLQIPRPFSRVVIVWGPPIEVPTTANASILESKHAEMQKLLESVRDTAELWFTLSPAERERERARLDAPIGG